ncbi:MAG: hypothetical protein VB144_12850 [Clostridia bacterium]|nr:hypothetical protein [Clostridia bacterium]
MDLDGHRLVPLFDCDDDLTVRVKYMGKKQKPILKRHPLMEQAIIEIVEDGLSDDAWDGLIYIMGRGNTADFVPIYVDKTERRGVQHSVSENIRRIRTNKHEFARWGDGLDYHIGDLSHAVFGFKAYRAPTKKYRRWADVLFQPPVTSARLKRPVSLYLAPWFSDSRGPSGLVCSVAAAEKEIISLASVQFSETLINVDGA